MSKSLERVVEELKTVRRPLHEKCTSYPNKPCSKAEDGYCMAYAFPDIKWRLGDCPLADVHLRTSFEPKTTEKKRVGQQKQKKRR